MNYEACKASYIKALSVHSLWSTSLILWFVITVGNAVVNLLSYLSIIMINPALELLSFLKYWYFRYMMVTELYMVEVWERNFINCFLITSFILVFVFNYKVLLPVTQLLTDNST